MKTITLAATLSALVPGKTNGVSASATTIATRTSASQRLRGRSWESKRLSIASPSSSAVDDRIEALRPPHQHRDHQADAREHRQLRRDEADVVGDQADEQRADQAAERRAEAADDDDDEEQHVDLAADLRGDDLLVHSPEAPAQAGERRAGREHGDEQAPDAVAEAFDHLAVLDAGADQEADLGAVERPEEGREDDQPDRHRDQAQLVDRRLADDDRAAQRLGRWQRDLRRAPHDLDQLLADDRAAERDQDLLQVLPVYRPDDDALEAEAERARDEHRRQRRDEDGGEVEPDA